MSLFSAIAHEGAPPKRGFWSRGMRMIVAGVVVASLVGLVVVNTGQPEPESTTLEEMAPSTGAIGAAVDPFIEANTTALDWLLPAVGESTSGDAFIVANTTGLEYPVAPYTERWNGPR